MTKKKKLFVLDTNVLAHDWQSVFKFEKNDIAIPFTVIQELDNLKIRGGNVSYNARNALKFLDKYDGNMLNKNSIGEGLGNVFVFYISDVEYIRDYKNTHAITNKDDEIIMDVVYLQDKNKDNDEYEQVILVSKDAGMRVKSSALDVKASDYMHDSVQVDKLYKGKYELDISADIINQLHQKQKYVEAKNTSFLNDNENRVYNYNSCFILRSESNHKHASLACFQKDRRDEIISDTLVGIQKRKKSQKIKIETINAEQTMAYHLLMNKDLSLVTINGIAGSGKTLMALLSAVDQTVVGGAYKKIIAMRPLVSLSNKEIGFLPGDEKQKIAPYMRPLYDNLEFIRTRATEGVKQKIKQCEEDGTITIEAMAHIRGRTYNDTILIIDEAQNLTPMEAKTIITRMGKNSKIVLVGDVLQIDSPYLNESSNGLAHVIDKFSRENYPYYGHITLEKGERSELSSLAAKIL